MKNYKLILGSILFITLFALNISVNTSSSQGEVSLFELSTVQAEPEAGDWDGKSDVGCVECSHPGTVQYYCAYGSQNCFQTDCVGGIC